MMGDDDRKLNEQQMQLVKGLLESQRRDSIVDVSDAVNSTFFKGEVDCPTASTGGVFLTGAAGAKSGNLTERLLFHEAASPVECSIGGEQTGTVASPRDRWIRGVLITSSTPLMPKESVFVDERSNSRMLFENTPLAQLKLRVVPVSLPTFVPNSDRNLTAAGGGCNLREILEEYERTFLRGLLVCISSLLRRRVALERAEKSAAGSEGDNNGSDCNTVTSPLREEEFFFDGELPVLSVPIYYFAISMEDNATSRIADVVDVVEDFMHLLIDAATSVVMETTVILQCLVHIANTFGANGPQLSENVSESNDAAAKEALLALHRLTEVMVKKTREKQEPRGAVKTAAARNDDCTEAAEQISSDVAWPARGDGFQPLVLSLGNDLEPSDFLRATLCVLPGVLVHCLKGVSRSPSIIMAYYIRRCAGRIRTPLQQVVEGERGSLHSDDPTNNAAPSGDESGNGDMHVFSFSSLLQCLQRARPVVNPQVCFLAELRSMWMRITRERLNYGERTS
ncbi:kinetoplastid-specific dual specificity phosphatase [Trypanosoma brucei equiperdum]|uniref:Kinetoplastid-specific dual specificity phosphatase n=1 Tax=Trypanosoma brucei equiperdum TaxID=630700 RepID=A0A3L6KWU5_9TRYP|nr:kinetoplastid-specific dual specificity phosphatase [Trypanosoma brucei equiperdum]